MFQYFQVRDHSHTESKEIYADAEIKRSQVEHARSQTIDHGEIRRFSLWRITIVYLRDRLGRNTVNYAERKRWFTVFVYEAYQACTQP